MSRAAPGGLTGANATPLGTRGAASASAPGTGRLHADSQPSPTQDPGNPRYDLNAHGPSRDALLHYQALSREDQQTLERERRAQRDLLDRPAQQVSPQELLDMARHNILARRNGHGEALVFLDPAEGPADNARWLTEYLHRVSDIALRSRDARLKVHAQDVVEHVAHLLVKTDWFDDAPAEELGKLANRLSKHLKAPPCRCAMTWIAQQVQERTPDQMRSAKPMALLFNAFAKQPKNLACEAAADHMAGLMTQRPGLVHGLGDIGVGMALNALSKWPKAPHSELAAVLVAERLDTEPRLRQGIGDSPFTLSLNGLSHFAHHPTVASAMQTLASHVQANPGMLKEFPDHFVSMSVHAFGRLKEEQGLRADPVLLEAVHAFVAHANLKEHVGKFSPQNLANMLNGLSKWPRDEACRGMVCELAQRISHEPRLVEDLNAQDAVMALNSVSKAWEEDACRDAAAAIAQRMVREDQQPRAGTGPASRPPLVDAFSPRQVSEVLNAFGKWPQHEAATAAVPLLARRLHQDPAVLAAFNAQDMSLAMNALSKLPQSVDCRVAAHALVRRFNADADLRRSFNGLQANQAFNAIAKWHDVEPLRADVAIAAGTLAKRLLSSPGFPALHLDNHVGTLMNAMSKWTGSPDCSKALKLLAKHVHEDPDLLGRIDEQQLCNVLNAASKHAGDPDCLAVAHAVADRVAQTRADLLDRRKFTAIGLTTLANSFGTWVGDDVCLRGLRDVTEAVGTDGRHWREFDMPQLAQWANAMSRLALGMPDDAGTHSMATTRLQTLARHLAMRPQLLQQANGVQIGMLFKALGSVQLQKSMRPLAETAIKHLHKLCDKDQFRGENLEAMATLCAGLLPLARSPDVSRFHKATLKLLDKMQPILQRKIDLYMATPEAQGRAGHDAGALAAGRAPEECGARRPALAMYLVLKTYSVVQTRWTASNIGPGDLDEIEAHRAQLGTWLDDTLNRGMKVISEDLQEMSWNLIAEIQAGQDKMDALDLRMHKIRDELIAKSPPVKFDLAAVRDSMNGEFGALEPGVGDTHHIVMDMRGKELVNEKTGVDGEAMYSFYAHATGQPLVEMQLPGKLSGPLLSRTTTRDNEQWRFDLFGGSRMKKPAMRVENIMAGAPSKYGKLPALRYSDTLPESDTMKMIAKFAPQREDWSRVQRAVVEMVPRSHVGVGKLRIGLFKDVPVNAPHPFTLKTASGETIQVCPDDGSGFLKYETAIQIPAIRELIEAWRAQRRGEAVSEKKFPELKPLPPATMTPQALQHYPPDDEAVEEARQAIQDRLQTLADEKAARASPGAPPSDKPLAPEDLSKLELHRLMTCGAYEGAKMRAVASRDDKYHLPAAIGARFDRYGGDVAVGKPPYDKENLLPVPASRIATEGQGDATSIFLGQECFAMQYSHNGFDDDTGDGLDGMHAKGMLLIPHPKYSDQFGDLDIACSTNDLKTLSRWLDGRDRDGLPEKIDSASVVRNKERLIPGRVGAIPKDELRKRDMDTDGDDAYIYAGYPKLVAMMKRVMADRAERRGKQTSFKPPKTAKPAHDAYGVYQPGRGQEILDAERGGVLLGKASNAASRFLSQPPELRDAMAQAWMYGTYDGIERDLRDCLRGVMRKSKKPDMAAVDQLLDRARAAVGQAHLPEAKEVAQLLAQEVELWRQGLKSKDTAEHPKQPLPKAIGELFPKLSHRYEEAKTQPERLAALLNNYPVCLLPPSEFPHGQPGYIDNELELTMRNLFTMAVKVGTDALKTDAGTERFTEIMRLFEDVERSFPDRVKSVPHSKESARQVRDDRFDPQFTLEVLDRIDTMAAKLMKVNIEALQSFGVLPETPSPMERVAAHSTPEQRTDVAKQLRRRYGELDKTLTPMIEQTFKAFGGTPIGEDHRLKSPESLVNKLEQLIGMKGLTLDQASGAVNDALRYSVTLSPDNFVDPYRDIVAALEDQGLECTQAINHWMKRDRAFMAVSSTFQTKDGDLLEIQFHTPESYQFKDDKHDVYKEGWNLQMQRWENVDASEAEKIQKDIDETIAGASKLTRPTDIHQIEDWYKPVPEAKSKSRKAKGKSAAQPQAPQAPIPPEAHRVRQDAEALERRLSPNVRAEVGKLGGSFYAEKEWHKHVLKNEKSIAEKIRRIQHSDGVDAATAAERVGDALRYMVKFDPDELVAQGYKLLKRFEAEGMEVMRIYNGFDTPDTTYAGVNINLRTPEGEDFELQLHSADSLKAKQRSHKWYEKDRKLVGEHDLAAAESDGDQVLLEEHQRYVDNMRSIAAGVPRPKNIDRIKSFNNFEN